MKRLLALLISIFILSEIDAQEVVEQVKLGKYHDILAQAHVLNSGFVLVTGSTLGGKHEVNVRFFGVDGKQRWEREVSGKFLAITTQIDVLVSPNGEHIFLIQMHSNGYNDNKHYISHFNLNGEETKFVVQGRNEFGYGLQTIFCDNDYLYYLATDKGDEGHAKKKSSENLILNRFDRRDFAYKRYVLNLPSVEGNENTTFWSLIGQHENNKFLASKNLNIDKGQYEFSIVSFNSNGEAENQITISANIPAGKFSRPVLTNGYTPWQSAKVNLDRKYNGVISEYNSASGNMRDLSGIVTTGGFSQIFYSNLHNAFYVFGLYGPDRYRNDNSIIEGFYIYKYDSDGVTEWEKHESIKADKVKEISEDFQLTPILNNELSAIFGVQGFNQPYLISEKVTPAPKYKFADYRKLKIYFHSTSDLKSVAFIKEMELRYDDRLFCVDNGSELSLLFDSKKSIIEVRYFK